MSKDEKPVITAVGQIRTYPVQELFSNISKSGQTGNVTGNSSNKYEIRGTDVKVREAASEYTPTDKFRNLVSEAEFRGDFAPLGKFFDSLAQADRDQYFLQIPAIFSKLGPSHDIREKLALLDKVNVSASVLAGFRTSIFQMEARERYAQMKVEGTLETLSDKEFAGVCRSIASSRVDKGFASVEDGGSESARRAAAAEVARTAIAGGTMEASKQIGTLPPGMIRDEAAAELVLWLRRTGSADEAAPWVATITDEKAKERIAIKIAPQDSKAGRAKP